jgi:general stress protein 26
MCRLLFVASIWFASFADRATAQGSPARLDSAARTIVAAARYATFITVDSIGQPQVRTVQPRNPDSAWTVWFATNPLTRKVHEVEGDHRVALHYFDPGTESYVAITGRARVVRDRATKDAQWDRSWDPFYTDREAGVVLIAVEAERIEVVSPRLGIDSDATSWRPQAFGPRAAAEHRGRWHLH